MSKKTASWTAAVLTLFLTLLLGAVLLRPVLVESENRVVDSTSDGTVIERYVPADDGYEYDDDDGYHDDQHEDSDEEEHDDDDD